MTSGTSSTSLVLTRTKVEEIALAIEEAVLSGELTPGAFLRQEDLSAEFGVSRTPVREALRQLSAKGLVSTEPNRGARVRTFSSEELWETYLIRAELEGLAAQLAVTRIEPSDLVELHQIASSFSQLAKHFCETFSPTSSAEALALAARQTNSHFHDLILHASRSPILEETARILRRIFPIKILQSNRSLVQDLFDSEIHHHELILAALETNPLKAREAVTTHVLESRDLFQKIFDSGTPRPLFVNRT